MADAGECRRVASSTTDQRVCGKRARVGEGWVWVMEGVQAGWVGGLADSWIDGFGCWILDAGCWIQKNFGCYRLP